MVNKKARGKRAKTRHKLKGKPEKATVNKILKPFEQGSRVQIDIRSDLHKGMPPAIYQGIFGVVSGKQGSAYKVSVRKGSLERTVIVNGVHLKQGEARK